MKSKGEKCARNQTQSYRSVMKTLLQE